MTTRTRRPVQTEEEDQFLSDPLSSDMLVDDVTDDDIEAFLEEQEGEKQAGFSVSSSNTWTSQLPGTDRPRASAVIGRTTQRT